jgi:hypothetical protein
VALIALLALMHLRVSRLLLFFIDGGASIKVASTMVPPDNFIPFL